jgi:hypothetical protein
MALLVVNRLLEPDSEFRVHRHWFVESGVDVLLEEDFGVAAKDRLYRCLDRILEHRAELFVWLKQKWAELFAADFEVLLYDLTSTYFEGALADNPKARRGYSRDHWPDCPQVVIALVVTPDGFPLAYEVLNGNTTEHQTLAPGLTPTAVLEKLGTVQMIDVWIPTLDGRRLILPRDTQPAKDRQMLLDKIRLALPSQPPPRITAAQAGTRSA